MQILPRIKKLFIINNIVAVFVTFFIVWAAFSSVEQGLSQYLASNARFLRSNIKASEAIEYDRTNPEAYKTRGVLAMQKSNFEEAVSDFKLAIERRPDDYLLWMRLGYAYYKLNDFSQAHESYYRASVLAPHYAQPQWYKGYLYLKTGDTEQAFAHLSAAAAIDSSLLRDVLHRARRTFLNDPVAVEKAVKLNSTAARKEAAFYFLKHRMMADGTKAFLLGSELDDRSKEEFVSRLIENKNFSLAYSVWASESSSRLQPSSENDAILNGDFEAEINPLADSFGWKVTNDENIVVSIDQKIFSSGTVGIKIRFAGNSNHNTAILSQLALLGNATAQKYNLTFAAQTEELTTGGLPVISIVDADSKKVLGQSSPIKPTTKEWQNYTVDFKPAGQTEAVIVIVQRLNCATGGQCPAFGTLWLDNLSLKKLTGSGKVE